MLINGHIITCELKVITNAMQVATFKKLTVQKQLQMNKNYANCSIFWLLEAIQ